MCVLYCYTVNLGVKASASTQISYEASREFERSRSSHELRVLGADPPTDGDLEAWLMKSEAQPNPIAYKLRPITELLKVLSFVWSNFFTL